MNHRTATTRLPALLLTCLLACPAWAEPASPAAASPATGMSNAAGIQIRLIEEPPANANDDWQITPSIDQVPQEISTVAPVPPAVSGASKASNDIAIGTKLVTSSDDMDLWQRIRSGYALPALSSPYTQKHESWYATRPDYVARMVERSQKYLYHIVEEVEKRGMPSEIALLPMIESAYNPQAYSRSHAAGIWQFIPSTGKNFGLQQNWWVDKRRDITAATDAALTYLQKLHLMFGTWDLALAAYNAGEGTVSRAIEYNRKRGLPTDYASLNLSDETRNYVPKLMAIKNIMTTPEKYGLQLRSIDNSPYFTSVDAPIRIDAKIAAKLAGISEDEFTALNPEYKRPLLTGSGSDHQLLLPIDAADLFTQNLANYAQPLVSWQSYPARRGERLQEIAQRFGVSLEALKQANQLSSKSKTVLSAGPLLIPSASLEAGDDIMREASSYSALEVAKEPVAKNSVTAQASARKRYKVKSGDSLFKIAHDHATTTQQIMLDNQLRTAQIKPGQWLTIAVVSGDAVNSKQNDGDAAISSKPAVKSKGQRLYIVKQGDTLSSIARKFDVASADLKRWNNLSSSRIKPGHTLVILEPAEA